eukprot:scaffold112622_cov28-Tisochrysis_lutea.AAC.1
MVSTHESEFAVERRSRPSCTRIGAVQCAALWRDSTSARNGYARGDASGDPPTIRDVATQPAEYPEYGRTPQSAQSSPIPQLVYSEPGPPSSQKPSLTQLWPLVLHVSVHRLILHTVHGGRRRLSECAVRQYARSAGSRSRVPLCLPSLPAWAPACVGSAVERWASYLFSSTGTTAACSAEGEARGRRRRGRVGREEGDETQAEREGTRRGEKDREGEG